jgi:CheY-like chemotaxis protein
MENLNGRKSASGFGTVLLIEDEEIVMEVTRAMIEKMGCTVIEALLGKAAVDAAADMNQTIDLALMDMDMPDMKGPEIFDRLKELRPGIKVVVCSGQDEDSTVRNLFEKGADGFLQKPFSYKKLEEVLVKHLDRRTDPRVRVLDNFMAVLASKGERSIKVIDISKGGLSFVCGKSLEDRDALIDVAVILAEKGVNIDELECRIVSDRTLDPDDPETGEAMKRIGVSFGKMTKAQFESLSKLIEACGGNI